LSLFSAIFHISKYEQENRAKLAWPPVHVRNDVASVLDRTDQLDLVTFPLHNPAQLGCGLVALNLTLNAMIRVLSS